MRSFLTFITAIFILNACSSDANNSPYPAQVGSFTIQSEIEAYWTGTEGITNSKAITASGDTLRFTRPDSVSMMVIATNVENGFLVQITDSSITGDFFRENDIEFDLKEITDGEDGITLTGTNVGGGPGEPITPKFSGTFNCDSTIVSDNTEFIYSFFNGRTIPENHVRSYTLVTNGFREMLDILVCNEPL